MAESKIARMKVDELRRELKGRGVKGTADLKKPELVKKLIKAEQKSDGAKASTGTKGSAKSGTKATKSDSSAKASSGGKNPTSHNDTPNTPGVNESEIARLKVSELRSRLSRQGVKADEGLKKPELVKKLVKALTGSGKSGNSGKSTKDAAVKVAAVRVSTVKTTTTTKGSTAKGSAAKGSATKGAAAKGSAAKGSTAKKSAVKNSAVEDTGTKGSGGKRLGKKASSSLQYSQEIKSTGDRPERLGRSLVTTDHEVIRQWAKARRAVPSTVPGTDHDGHLGVLRFDFPGYSGDRLVEVSWAEWFEAFDKRRLNFIYQERRIGGELSNFFQLENPDE